MTKKKVARKKVAQRISTRTGSDTAHILGTSGGGYEGLIGFLRNFNAPIHEKEKPPLLADLDNSPEADRARTAYALPMAKLYELAGYGLTPENEPADQRKKARGLSDFTRGVMAILAQSPDANGLEISRGLDLNGITENKFKKYEDAYKGSYRKQLDSRYSKIRRRMRKLGLKP